MILGICPVARGVWFCFFLAALLGFNPLLFLRHTPEHPSLTLQTHPLSYTSRSKSTFIYSEWWRNPSTCAWKLSTFAPMSQLSRFQHDVATGAWGGTFGFKTGYNSKSWNSCRYLPLLNYGRRLGQLAIQCGIPVYVIQPWPVYVIPLIQCGIPVYVIPSIQCGICDTIN